MKHRAFPDHIFADAPARYQRAGQWLLATVFENERAKAWCEKNGVLKAQGESINSAGGLLTPAELSDVILDLRDVYGAFRRRARIVPMGSDSIRVPRHAGGAIATWTGENVAATATTATVDTVGLTVRKCRAEIDLSSELEQDSLPDIVDYVANEAAFALAQKEDDAAFNGDGSSTYAQQVGLAAISGKSKITAAHNTYATLTAADFAAVMAGVRASAIGNASWFISQLGFATSMCALAGTSNGYLDYAEIDGIRTPLYLGFPVILTQKLPQVTSSLSGKLMLGFGDMYAAGVLGQRRGVTIQRSDQRYADTDQIGVWVSERVHCVLHDTGDASTFGSIAGLFGS